MATKGKSAKRTSSTLGLQAPMQRVRPVPVNVALARRVLALAQFLDDEDSFSTERVKTSPCKSTGHALWVDFGEREPSVSHAVSPLTGAVFEHTCQYSGHNGDSYNDTFRALFEEEALTALQGLVRKLEGRALAKEERRLAESADRRRTEAALKNLNARLKAMGLV